MVTSSQSSVDEMHKLSNKWTIYAHLPHDTDWTLASYKTLFATDRVEEFITLTESLPDQLISNCMLFIMRSGIQPTWEDESNANGGCFSYKITNKFVKEVWTRLTYSLLGETLTKNKDIHDIINGITISPKKNFCIIKIWMANCLYQNPTIITNEIMNLPSSGSIFKKHTSVSCFYHVSH